MALISNLPVFTFTFVWRVEPDGDIFQRDYRHYHSTGCAVKAWNKIEGLDIVECCEFSFTRKQEA
jgi:hypothetical protein